MQPLLFLFRYSSLLLILISPTGFGLNLSSDEPVTDRQPLPVLRNFLRETEGASLDEFPDLMWKMFKVKVVVVEDISREREKPVKIHSNLDASVATETANFVWAKIRATSKSAVLPLSSLLVERGISLVPNLAPEAQAVLLISESSDRFDFYRTIAMGESFAAINKIERAIKTSNLKLVNLIQAKSDFEFALEFAANGLLQTALYKIKMNLYRDMYSLPIVGLTEADLKRYRTQCLAHFSANFNLYQLRGVDRAVKAVESPVANRSNDITGPVASRLQNMRRLVGTAAAEKTQFYDWRFAEIKALGDPVVVSAEPFYPVDTLALQGRFLSDKYACDLSLERYEANDYSSYVVAQQKPGLEFKRSQELCSQPQTIVLPCPAENKCGKFEGTRVERIESIDSVSFVEQGLLSRPNATKPLTWVRRPADKRGDPNPNVKYKLFAGNYACDFEFRNNQRVKLPDRKIFELAVNGTYLDGALQYLVVFQDGSHEELDPTMTLYRCGSDRSCGPVNKTKSRIFDIKDREFQFSDLLLNQINICSYLP